MAPGGASGQEALSLGFWTFPGKWGGLPWPRSWMRKAVSGRFCDVQSKAHEGRETQILNPVLFQEATVCPRALG